MHCLKFVALIRSSHVSSDTSLANAVRTPFSSTSESNTEVNSSQMPRPSSPGRRELSPRTFTRDSPFPSHRLITSFFNSTAVCRIFYFLDAGVRSSSDLISSIVLRLFSGPLSSSRFGGLFTFGRLGVLGGVGRPG